MKAAVVGIFIPQKSTNVNKFRLYFFQRASLAAHHCGRVQVGGEKVQELVHVKCGGRNSGKKTSEILGNDATRGPSFQTPGGNWDSSSSLISKSPFHRPVSRVGVH